jgi:putative ABC transport system permease protein
MEQAQREMRTIGLRLERQYPTENKGRNVGIYRAADVLTAGTKLPLFLLLGTVTLILLIACMNIANMLLARTQNARRETAVRIALGASTREVASHFFVETLILCCLGTLLGVAGALTVLQRVVPALPLALPKYATLQVDWHVLLFAVGLAVLTALALTVGPAMVASRFDLNEALHEGGRSSATKGRRRSGAVLVVVEVALAMMLLSASGLLLRSLMRLHSSGLGFAPDHLVTMRIEVPAGRYGLGSIVDSRLKVSRRWARRRAMPPIIRKFLRDISVRWVRGLLKGATSRLRTTLTRRRSLS